MKDEIFDYVVKRKEQYYTGECEGNKINWNKDKQKMEENARKSVFIKLHNKAKEPSGNKWRRETY